MRRCALCRGIGDRLRRRQQGADCIEPGGLGVFCGEFVKFLERPDNSGMVRMGDSGSIIGLGLIWIAHSQVGQAPAKVKPCVRLALNSSGIMVYGGRIDSTREGKVAQAGVSVGMVGGQGARLLAILLCFLQTVKIDTAAGAIAIEQSLVPIRSGEGKGRSISLDGPLVFLLLALCVRRTRCKCKKGTGL
jgi:hypothetical protein